jgi:virginiamycin B lyase
MLGLQRLVRWVLGSVSAVALVACSSGITPPAGPVPQAPAQVHRVTATLRILIPKREHRHRIRVHGHYISPATQGLTLAISRGSGVAFSETIALTPQSNPQGCSNTPSGTLCLSKIPLAPCPNASNCYTASIATYDAIAGCPSACSITGANELSANQSIAFNVAAGAANQVSATLDGIPSVVQVVPGPYSALTGGGNTGRFAAPKCSTTTNVNVMSLDIDGNYIIGAGAPTPSLRSETPAVLTVSAPVPSHPLTFGLTHPVLTTATPVTLVATVTPLAGSGSITPVTSSPIVTIAGGTEICGVFTEYATSANPTDIALGSDQELWFSEFLGGKIGRMTTAGALTEYAAPNGPADITPGPDGALWFTEPFATKIGRITTGGLLSEFSTGITSGPGDITTGSDGNLWFTEPSKPGIARITPGGTVTEDSVESANSKPNGITSGPDGALWFTECAVSQIGRFATNGLSISEYGGIGTNVKPMGIVAGPDSNLWFVEFQGNAIGSMSTSGTVNQIVSIPTPASGVMSIAVGPDGALWFTESLVNKIGRITTAGAITEYTVPTALGGPESIVAGPDGALWFTEANVSKIGRLQ